MSEFKIENLAQYSIFVAPAITMATGIVFQALSYTQIFAVLSMTQFPDDETRGIWSADSVYYAASDAVSIVVTLARLGMIGFSGWIYLQKIIQAFFTTTYFQELNFWINITNCGLIVVALMHYIYNLAYYVLDIVTLMRYVGNQTAKIKYLTFSEITSSDEKDKDPGNFINWIYYYTAGPKKL